MIYTSPVISFPRIGLIGALLLLPLTMMCLILQRPLFDMGFAGKSVSASVHISPQSGGNITETVSVPPCSLPVLNQYITNSDFFPSEGQWVKNGEARFYIPELCTFLETRNLSKEYIGECFRTKKLRELLILGDSNGRRYHTAFRKFLTNIAYKCKEIKAEVARSNLPDVSYFVHGTNINVSDIRIHRRDCNTCRSVLTQCASESELVPDVQLEYIAMEYNKDTELSTCHVPESRAQSTPTKYEHKEFDSRNHLPESNTTQEFIFMEYLKGRYPDFIFLFGNSHDCCTRKKKNLSQVQEELEYLLNLLNNSLPIVSKVMWLPVHGHYWPRKKKSLDWEEYQSINRLWFDVLKPAIAQGTNMYGFFDLQSISKEILPIWVDNLPVHLAVPWYDLLASFIMQTICN